MFQSTHPQRVRRIRKFAPIHFKCFNPRTHKGCDSVNLMSLPDRRVSIHAPTKGATTTLSTHTIEIIHVSIHAPTKGATNADVQLCKVVPVSIHAPTKGATQCSQQQRIDSTVSIHAPTKGATQCSQQQRIDSTVSIHAPTKGATYL